ncbi:ABC-three component system protein [Peribacillus simplex]|uniref:ABC-three component systems C-terminal domain-containing protein n=1 Tax=Peribacillus simplex TaxID=1478 RepID=A0AAN2PEK2_9BACI|nr:ABC-three component system protein [Peribacillus simplex]CEG31044.1 hypothetical protein BN1180_01180 [Peribacillus simplex]
MPNMFSAGSSAVGYLYQVRYALYLILKKIDLEISIEKLDDVAFESQGTPIELLQLKHHLNQSANLTDGSSDLWKTIRVWSEAIKEREIILPGVMLTLVTTSSAQDNSISSLLRDDIKRDPISACAQLVNYALKSKSDTNKSSYESFLSLGPDQQLALVESIYILDSTEGIVEVEELIKKTLLLSTREKYLVSVYERLEGWWLQKTINHLVSGSQDTINGSEVRTKLQDIIDQFRNESLPIDYLYDDPEESNLTQDNRLFVNQLKLINVSSIRIKKAVRDYYRASKQRSRWVSEELLSIDEIFAYEKRLFEEWEEHFEMVNENPFKLNDEIEFQERGKLLYNGLINQSYPTIRRDCTEPYVLKGSLHILANKKPLRIGWHPFYSERLKIHKEDGEEVV